MKKTLTFLAFIIMLLMWACTPQFQRVSSGNHAKAHKNNTKLHARGIPVKVTPP